MADNHAERQQGQPFKGVPEGDVQPALGGGEKALPDLVMAAHADMTTEQFGQTARAWLPSAKHPKTNLPYTAMVYQQMLEGLGRLRANGFKAYNVSGGGIEFMRVLAEDVYGVPPEQVIGSSIKTEFEMRDDGPVLMRRSEIDFIDDKAGKPVAIHKSIGQRPLAAFGVTCRCCNGQRRVTAFVWASSSVTPIENANGPTTVTATSARCKIDKALDEAPSRGWVVVDMKNDSAEVFSRVTYGFAVIRCRGAWLCFGPCTSSANQRLFTGD